MFEQLFFSYFFTDMACYYLKKYWELYYFIVCILYEIF